MTLFKVLVAFLFVTSAAMAADHPSCRDGNCKYLCASGEASKCKSNVSKFTAFHPECGPKDFTCTAIVMPPPRTHSKQVCNLDKRTNTTQCHTSTVVDKDQPALPKYKMHCTYTSNCIPPTLDCESDEAATKALGPGKHGYVSKNCKQICHEGTHPLKSPGDPAIAACLVGGTDKSGRIGAGETHPPPK